MWRFWLVAGFLGGCAYREEQFVTTLPAEGVTDVFCDLERGTFVYDGSGAEDVFEVGIASWGTGGSGSGAEKRAANNTWGAQVSDGLLDLWGRSPLAKAGVDVVVVGKRDVDVEAVLLDGPAHLYDVEGTHVVTANAVVGSGIAGDVDFYAALDGINVEVWPVDGGTVRLEAFGDVLLALPFGLDYDLEVFADPDWGVQVTDLGFDELFLAPDYVFGESGDGSIEVDVFVSGGVFALFEAVPAPTTTPSE